MKKLVLENIVLELVKENDDVRVSSPTRSFVLFEQTIENVSSIIQHNFKVVDSHYKSMIAQHPEIGFDLKDIHTISMKIVLRFLYMYNSWRVQYRRPKYDNLDFKEEDFDDASAADIIFDYYRVNYPADWQEKCAVLMGKDLEALKHYFQRRQDYHNG
jgi:hypothetical protein